MGIADSVAKIHIIDVPELKWDPAWTHQVIGCDDADSITFGAAAELYGYGPWVIRYSIQALDSNGNPSGSPTTDSTVIGKVGDKSVFETMFLPGSQFDAQGKYKVEIKNITDRFSRKSLDYLYGKIPAGSVSGDENDPGFTVTIIPAPKTKRLKHVSNIRK
jgi:hypothetical protein